SGGGFQYLSSDHSPFNSAAIRLDDLLDNSVQPVVPSGTYIPEYVLTQEESPLKVLMIQAASPMTQWPNTNKAKRALEKIPFKVCIDLELTDTARLCDFVLPATTIFEHHNLVHSELHRIVQYAPKLVKPRDEARDELWMWTEIAKRIGLGEYFELSELDAIRIALQSEDCKKITLEELIKHPEGIRTNSQGIPFTDKKFRTPSGKVELYSKELEEIGHDPLPFHEEPEESPLSTPEVYKDYPLIMISGRLRERLHSQYTTVEVGGGVRSYSHCTTCQKCVKECPDEAITLRPPSPEEMYQRDDESPTTHSSMRETLGTLVGGLAVKLPESPLEIPDEITGLLIPEWDSKKCIGCRECAIDVCPYDVVTDTITQVPMQQTPERRAYIRMHPYTAVNCGLKDGDRVDVESKRGRLEGIRLELTEEIDPRIVWSSDGWWARDGNINLLTDDRHTSFGHTPGFNSVLVRVKKSI
ncbi:MAG: molybdopterin dinucleotide binding domain-containing protein, partial [Candidatus Thorarchaeota archaeon]